MMSSVKVQNKFDGIGRINRDVNMYKLQEKAIDAARTVLLSRSYCSADRLEFSDMYVVWFCKTLQNWKALVSGVYIKKYIEVTYDGDRKETYVDVYQKAGNECLMDFGDEECQ